MIDETDVKILKKLLTDARSSYRKIAFEIGVSPPTVLNRISKLEMDNTIKSYSAVIDHAKLGFDLTAVIEITAVKNKITEVEKHISKLPNVCAVYDITGLTDMIIVLISTAVLSIIWISWEVIQNKFYSKINLSLNEIIYS